MKILSQMSSVFRNNGTKNFVCLFLFALAIVSCSEDTVDFEETGSITGTVLSSEDQEPIANAEVSTNPSSSTVFTNQNGEFTLNNVLVDSYAVQVEKNGFDIGFESVNVLADTAINVSFQLDPSENDNLAPSKPELIFPEDNADDIDVQVTLAWDSTDPEDDEIEYIISLRNGTTSEIEIFEVVQDTTVMVTDLNLSTTYFWQVTASDESNDPVSSDLQQFTTLESPSNPILFVREESGNNVIYSGGETSGDPDVNVIALTDDSFNSFAPRKNNDINKIAFLRTVAGATHLFSMDLSGENVQQISNNIPVAGFRLDALRYTWYDSGSKLLYPSFDKLISVNSDGSGTSVLYTTPDGSLISEVATPDFDTDLLVLKTNNTSGYNVRIFTYRLSTGMEETVILENQNGAGGSIDITASGDQVLYFRDTNGSQNNIYRIFNGRTFIYDMNANTAMAIETDAITGENDLDASFTPSEGGIVFTRVLNNVGATPSVYLRIFDEAISDIQLFTGGFAPNWE